MLNTEVQVQEGEGFKEEGVGGHRSVQKGGQVMDTEMEVKCTEMEVDEEYGGAGAGR